jgi:undecaprenyl-diphosphatase
MAQTAQQLHQWEAFVLNVLEGLRWEPLTMFFVLASAWWVKGPLFVAIGAVGDIRARRQFPFAATFAGVSALAAGALSMLLKQSFDRTRPPHSGIGVEPLVATPSDPSFPSGHTVTAFAAAAVVASFHPRLRWPVFGLAAVVGFSRMYLGVHYWLDVMAGAAVGIAVGYGFAWTAKRGRALWRLRALARARAG